jgi:hypothetical protein
MFVNVFGECHLDFFEEKIEDADDRNSNLLK